jgi:ribosomal-protein-alanine acetyltransferase
MRRFKLLFFRLLGKDPEAVVITFASGAPELVRRIEQEIRLLEPRRRHFTVPQRAGSPWKIYLQLRREFRHLRIGLAPVLFTEEPCPLRLAAFLLAPTKILAYNARLERHHLKLSTLIASVLFLRGLAVDRIYLRPWRDNGTRQSEQYSIVEGRPLSPSRPRVAILSPYFPYPLSHGGAVRIYNLLRESSQYFDLFLFSFAENPQPADVAHMMEFTARAVLMELPRYREPHWASLEPPDVREYESPVLRRLIAEWRETYGFELLQVEYTYLASYGGDVLVEHDVTWDLYQQIHRRERTLSSWWNLFRWRRYETSVLTRYRRIVAMSQKDLLLLNSPAVRVIGNGVDLDRFTPSPETPGARLLFVGSFRHFPNVLAYRFFVERVWPLLSERIPGLSLTVVAGPDPHLYWSDPTPDPRIEMHALVRDVRPLYEAANLVVVPTTVSAGTNLKVLEAMAMERAVVSTPSGCDGLGLEHARNIWVASEPKDFAAALELLLSDPELRHGIARDARRIAEERYGWHYLGGLQRLIWKELMSEHIRVRPGLQSDLAAVDRIQKSSPEAAQWNPEDCINYIFQVAEWNGSVAGFLITREVVGEIEILNLAIDPPARRRGLAKALLDHVLRDFHGAVFLEVRKSNDGARKLYESYGFRLAGLRRNYYQSPTEDAVVMRM